jgi:hypothetical protein
LNLDLSAYSLRSGGGIGSNIDKSEAVIDVVIDFADQIEDLTMCLLPHCFLSHIWVEAVGRLSRLRKLTLFGHGEESLNDFVGEFGPCLGAFSRASNLQHLALCSPGHALLFPLVQNAMPWSQITDIFFDTDEACNLAFILRNCGALTKAKLTLKDEWKDEDFDASSVFDFPHLSKFWIWGDDEDQITDVLATISAPSLTSLGISCWSRNWDNETRNSDASLQLLAVTFASCILKPTLI